MTKTKLVPGDLFEFEGLRCIVERIDRNTRLAVLRRCQDGKSISVPDDLDVKVLANPMAEWSTLTSPLKRKSGPLISIERPITGRVKPQILTQWVDWVPADPAQEGGSLFFAPHVRLRVGDFLLGTHKSGMQVRIIIPATFGTVTQKTSRSAPRKLKKEATIYDRMLQDPDEED